MLKHLDYALYSQKGLMLLYGVELYKKKNIKELEDEEQNIIFDANIKKQGPILNFSSPFSY